MVPAYNNRQRPCGKGCAHAGFNIGMAFKGVGMDYLRIAHIDNAYLPGQIGGIIFVIIGSGMAETKQR